MEAFRPHSHRAKLAPINTDRNKSPGKRRRKNKIKGEKTYITALESNGLEDDKITFEVSVSSGV